MIVKFLEIYFLGPDSVATTARGLIESVRVQDAVVLTSSSKIAGP